MTMHRIFQSSFPRILHCNLYSIISPGRIHSLFQSSFPRILHCNYLRTWMIRSALVSFNLVSLESFIVTMWLYLIVRHRRFFQSSFPRILHCNNKNTTPETLLMLAFQSSFPRILHCNRNRRFGHS